MLKLPDNVDIDPDIDLSQILSPNLKLLCLKYNSLFLGSHDNLDGIEFFEKQKRFFFTFTDKIAEVRADPSQLTSEEISEGGHDLAFFAPIVRAVYVLKGYRNKGLQRELFEDLKSVSEETAEPVIAVADPFIINDSVYEQTIETAIVRFVQNGYRRPHNWLNLVKSQCGLFGKYGFENFILSQYQLTIPPQHFIYVPSTASKGIKLAVRSLQVNPDVFSLEHLDEFDKINNKT